jgi:AcrR family transcriptional regulator
MTRTYTLKKRAEKQAETRQRIVEAAVDLHSTLGPARTPLSLVAEKAGVQRHTLYAHFPDEWSLLLACSGLAMERDPMPDAAAWEGISDPRERLETGLSQLYAWFGRNGERTGCVMRDAEISPLVKKVGALRTGPYFTAYAQVLGAGLGAKQRAALRLGLSFFTWRTLVRDSGLEPADAVELMVRAIEGADAG